MGIVITRMLEFISSVSKVAYGKGAKLEVRRPSFWISSATYSTSGDWLVTPAGLYMVWELITPALPISATMMRSKGDLAHSNSLNKESSL